MRIKLFAPGLFALLTFFMGMQQPLSASRQQHSQSRLCEHSSAATSDRRLEIVAGLLQGPGNPAVSKDGRIFITNHPFYAPEFIHKQLQKLGFDLCESSRGCAIVNGSILR